MGAFSRAMGAGARGFFRAHVVHHCFTVHSMAGFGMRYRHAVDGNAAHHQGQREQQAESGRKQPHEGDVTTTPVPRKQRAVGMSIRALSGGYHHNMQLYIRSVQHTPVGVGLIVFYYEISLLL